MSKKYLSEKEAKEFEARVLKIKVVNDLLLPQPPRKKNVNELLDLADRFLRVTRKHVI